MNYYLILMNSHMNKESSAKKVPLDRALYRYSIAILVAHYICLKKVIYF